MFHWFKELDRILRGEKTRLADLSGGVVDIPVVGVSLTLILLGFLYGACMGLFSLLRYDELSLETDILVVELAGYNFYVPAQLLASTLKVPALFFLTLLVTLPSLYVFNALVGSRLRIASVVRLLIASLGVNIAVLASLGPIVAFFSVCTPSYPFMVLLNVVVFTVAGLLGLSFLLQTLHRMTVALENMPPEEPPAPPVQPPPAPENGINNGGDGNGDEPGESQDAAAKYAAGGLSPPEGEVVIAQAVPEPGPLDMPEGHVLGRHVRTIFRLWVVIFGLVGAQMGWVLRPFIGAPGLEFQWFRDRQSNFFAAVIEAIKMLFGA